jgi:hypothetical protein
MGGCGLLNRTVEYAIRGPKERGGIQFLALGSGLTVNGPGLTVNGPGLMVNGPC